MREGREEGGRGRESGRREKKRTAQGGERGCWNISCPREKKQKKKKTRRSNRAR